MIPKAFRGDSRQIRRSVNEFFVASMLSALIGHVAVMIDGAMMGHLIGPDALAATGLYLPLNVVVISLYTLIGYGASVLLARAIGARDARMASGVSIAALAGLLLCGAVLGAAAWLFGDWMAERLCTQERLVSLLKEYLKPMAGLSVFSMLNMYLCKIVGVEGRPRLVTVVVLCVSLLNISLNYLFIARLGLGAAGAAWATNLSYLVSSLVLVERLLRLRAYRAERPSLRHLPRLALGAARQGLPLTIGNLLILVMVTGQNCIVQQVTGADGIFVLSISVNVLFFGLMFAKGFGHTTVAIGGILRGERDVRGLAVLVHHCLFLMLAILVALVALFEAFPQVLGWAFGAKTPELMGVTVRGLRMLLPAMIPFCLVVFLCYVYQILGHLKIIPLLMLAFPLFLLPTLEIGKWTHEAGHLSPEQIWWAFPLCFLAVLALAGVLTAVQRRGRPQLEPLTLVSRERVSADLLDGIHL